jgi:TATA-binding protein-associated factor Taf7
MSKIEEYLKTLTTEEREQHKDLIAECLEREKTITETRKETNEALKKLEVLEKRMYQNIEGLHQLALTVQDNLQRAYDQIKQKDPLEKLRTMGPDEFYKA